MHTYKQLLVWLIVGVSFAGCEIPKKPDFTTSHKVEAPVMYKKTLQFMGDSTGFSMIDTTSSSFDSLFVFNEDNSMSISKEQDFEFGDLNDAVPIVNVEPASFESEVGKIEINDFSSSDDDLGSADIEEVTGNDPNLIPSGTPIMAGNNNASPVRLAIGANTDFFRSATIKDGAMKIKVTNTLGFDFATTVIQVIDTTTNSQVGSSATFSSANGNQLSDGKSETASITFSEGDQLINLGVEIIVSWDAFNFPANPGALTVNSVVGDGLIASQVQAALDSQDFSTVSTAAFDADEFEFTDPSHFVELKKGRIIIAPIENQLQFKINLDLTFTDIRECPASLVGNDFVINNDPLTLSYTGAQRIRRADNTGSGFSPEANISLTGCKLYALNNEVSYNIDAFTEPTKEAPQGERIRVINENQSILSSVEISNLEIKRATGIIKRQNVLLNDDDGGDEHLDLFNDNEAEITKIDGLTDLSSQLKNIDFTNPKLSINYFSNISVPTTIYGAFIGTNGDGEKVYLKGTAGSKYQVQPTDSVSGLYANGVELRDDQLVKFTLDEINNETGEDGTPIEFNRTNTNVNDFLNNLPDEIRFVGKAVINEDEQEATILDNLLFDPKISIDIPLAFSTEQAATFTDTTDQSLDFVPSPDNGDSRTVTNGLLVIEYENGLPLSVDLSVVFMDSLYNEFESIPVAGEQINLMASEVDLVTRFASNKTSGTIQIALSENQLRQLYKTRFLKISAELLTTDTSGNGKGDAVRLRTTDSITLTVRAELTIESDINLDD